MRLNIRTLTIILCACALASCAKVNTESSNAAAQRAFEAWIRVHYPDAVKSDKGLYILEDKAGSGAEVKDTNYVYYNYEIRELYDSTITEHNDSLTAIMLNTYSPTAVYVPRIELNITQSMKPAMYETVNGSGKLPKMKVGGKRSVIVPGWISASDAVYASEEEYMSKVSSGTHYIYTVEIVDQTKDIIQRECEEIEDYIRVHNMTGADTTFHKGLYFWRNAAREKERGVTVNMYKGIPKDSTVYINYIGRLLSGRVFDTNIKDTALKYGVGTRDKSYTPQAVTFATDSTQLKMGSSSVISGFSMTIFNMHPFESATGIFTHNFGYGANGSGEKIPGYAPLIFEIDIVSKPE